MKKILFILPILFLFGCAPDDPRVEEREADEIYNQAVEYADDTNWNASAIEFIEIERQHPESELAAQGMIMAGYVYFKGDKHVDAVQTIDHFLRLHPSHKNVDYALYLKSMIYYDQISDVRREQIATVEALKTMLLLEEKFPESAYAKNVKAKIVMLKNYLAGKEMFIARKLMKEENYLGALKRFQLILKKFPKSIMRPEALFRMTEIYSAIHLPQQAENIKRILAENHPDSEWSKK